MTKPWRHKINSSNILLVLITSMLVEAEWASGSDRCCDHWNHRRTYMREDYGKEIIVGDNRISRYYFRSSTLTNPSLTLDNLNRCLDNFQLVTCLKMLLLDHINVAVDALRRPKTAETDFVFLDGLVSFKRTKNTAKMTVSDHDDHDDHDDHYNDIETSEISTLDEEIFKGIFKLFENRSLEINLAPKYRINVVPIPGSQKKNGFVQFRFNVVKEKSNANTKTYSQRWTGRSKKRKGGGMSMMMFIPQMIMLGFLPFTLASIKAMVMNAVMVNMMALNGAIIMTIRNLVFGPRAGSNVQYVNYGYSKDRQNQKKRPALIIHSPAAFVKQPEPHYSSKSHHQSFHPNHNNMHYYYHSTPIHDIHTDSHDKKFQFRDSSERWSNNYYSYRPTDEEYESNDVVGDANEEQIYHEEEEDEREEDEQEVMVNQYGGSSAWNVKTESFYGNEDKDFEDVRETTLFVRPTRRPFLHHGENPGCPCSWQRKNHHFYDEPNFKWKKLL